MLLNMWWINWVDETIVGNFYTHKKRVQIIFIRIFFL